MAIGHDILKAYALVQKAGLLTPPADAELEQSVVEWLGALWKARLVPYIRQGLYREPPDAPDLALGVVTRIVEMTQQHCSDQRDRHRIQLDDTREPIPAEVIVGQGCGCPIPDEQCER
ncbi:MAG: hypothetical protein DRQ55_09755 [Planctomycetota bacterium]|nr:MAG: hypothetical protein DRQ55_09755 [Planctomycetota bacterium]